MSTLFDSLSINERAMHYRRMASQTMQLAGLAHHPEARVALLRLADDWNSLASDLSNDIRRAN
jgi:hypothetical protein